jgi:sugar phosphate isomerase/epimerase
MQFGVSTIIIEDKDLISQLPTLAKYKVKNIEIRAKLEHFNYEDYRKVDLLAEKMKEFDIRAYSMHMPIGKVDISQEEEWGRVWSIREIEKAGLALSKLGGEILVVHRGGEVKGCRDGRIEKSLESLEELLDFCKEWGLKLALENTLPGELGDKIDELLSLVNKFNSSCMGICLDTGHINIEGNPIEAIKKIGSKLIHLHIQDNLGQIDNHFLPGKGNINWEKLINLLRQIKYEGIFMFEARKREEENLEELLIQTKSIFDEFFPEP